MTAEDAHPGRSGAPDAPQPFLDHLRDLRRTVLQSLAFLLVATALIAPLAPRLLDLYKQPLRGIVPDPDAFLASYEVTAAFMVWLRVAVSAGLLLAAPAILFVIGRFVFPGLTPAERRVVRRYLGLAIGMFLIGVAFAFGIILPLALRVMLSMHQWMGIHVAHVLVTNYIAFVTQLLLAFGVAFELPVVLLVMGRLGIVNAAQLRTRRRHVIVALLIVAMLMTPQDMATQLLMALPLIALYEICILLIARGERHSDQRR